ncbi:MAG TPA: NAD(+) diphosphatase [Galbitalea sp.]|jgi:NAD+ diphosphatase|nr:NAD(+) diphosphatase [Galbitalea sp.]
MSQSFLSRLPLSRFEVDRDYLSREKPDLFGELWANPATRILPIHDGRALISPDGALRLLTVSETPEATVRVYLGLTTAASATEPAATPVVAVPLADVLEVDGATWTTLRTVGSRLSSRDAGLLTEALGILNWHATHQFSPRTGEPTIIEKGGWVRRDPTTGAEHFPRTDAAIIVGITDADDRILLGSNALWENNRFSLLAGFVEPGESLEAAVLREVFEEAGIRVTDPVYLGSQPWPFPASLMLGFTARVDAEHPMTLTPDGAEILELRWFSRDELRASRGEVLLPGPTSIAHAILEEWFGEPITDGMW